MKLVRFLLVPTLVFSFSVTLLDAMEKPGVDEDDFFTKVLSSEETLRTYITQLVATGNVDELEERLVLLRNIKNNLSCSCVAHDSLVATVSKLVQVKSKDFVEQYFEQLAEGTLKMAIRFVYALTYRKNIDTYDAVALFCPEGRIGNLYMRFIAQLSTKPGTQTSYAVWHLDFSNSNLNEKALVPSVFSLLEPMYKRIYIMPLGSIDLGNNQHAHECYYLISDRVDVVKTDRIQGTPVHNGFYLKLNQDHIKYPHEDAIDVDVFKSL